MSDFNPADPAFWDKSAETYAAMAEPFTGLFAADALALAEIRPGTRLLDVATGTGAAAALASAKGAEVTAIDFSPGMIARVSAQNLARVSAHVMDGQALDLPDGSFDVSVSVFGVVLFPDWRRGLREMARVTRSGGTGIIATWQSPFGAGAYKLISELSAELFPETPLPSPFDGLRTLQSPERSAAELEAAGFADVEVKDMTHDFCVNVADPAQIETLFQFTPTWGLLSDPQRVAVMAALEARIARDRRGDILPIPSTALIACGIRR